MSSVGSVSSKSQLFSLLNGNGKRRSKRGNFAFYKKKHPVTRLYDYCRYWKIRPVFTFTEVPQFSGIEYACIVEVAELFGEGRSFNKKTSKAVAAADIIQKIKYAYNNDPFERKPERYVSQMFTVTLVNDLNKTKSLNSVVDPDSESNEDQAKNCTVFSEVEPEESTEGSAECSSSDTNQSNLPSRPQSVMDEDNEVERSNSRQSNMPSRPQSVMDEDNEVERSNSRQSNLPGRPPSVIDNDNEVERINYRQSNLSIRPHSAMCKNNNAHRSVLLRQKSNLPSLQLPDIGKDNESENGNYHENGFSNISNSGIPANVINCNQLIDDIDEYCQTDEPLPGESPARTNRRDGWNPCVFLLQCCQQVGYPVPAYRASLEDDGKHVVQCILGSEYTFGKGETVKEAKMMAASRMADRFSW